MRDMLVAEGSYKGLGDLLTDAQLYDMESYAQYLAGNYANVTQTFIPTMANGGIAPPVASSLAPRPSSLSISKNLVFGLIAVGAVLLLKGK